MAKLTTKFKSLKKTTKVDFATYLGVIAVFIVVTVLQNGGMLNRKTIGLLVPICCYMSMAVSLNLTVGILGELSLGHAGFMSVGAFSGIVMAMWLSKGVGLANETVCLLLAILTGGVAAGIAGVLIGIPVLRLRGDYLAIVTLAFGEIIRNVLNCLYISMGPGTEKFVASATDPNVFTKTLALDRVHAQLDRMIRSCCEGYGCAWEMDMRPACKVVWNDAKLTEMARRAAKRVSPDGALPDAPCALGDDFADYRALGPICYARVGVRNEAVGACHPHHSDQFRIDESALPAAVAWMAAMADEFFA